MPVRPLTLRTAAVLFVAALAALRLISPVRPINPLCRGREHQRSHL